MATRTRRWRSRTRLGRDDSALVGRDGSGRGASSTSATAATTAKNTNVPRRPTTSKSRLPMIGPVANPARSTRARRPRFSPDRAGSMLATMARAAGMKHPAAAPIRAREASSIGRVWARAKPIPPMAARPRPTSRRRLARPRSAIGATTRPATRPTMKPVPAMSPRLDVDWPVASWRSEMRAKMTLVEALRTNVETKIRPQAGGDLASGGTGAGARDGRASPFHAGDATGPPRTRRGPIRRGPPRAPSEQSVREVTAEPAFRTSLFER